VEPEDLTGDDPGFLVGPGGHDHGDRLRTRSAALGDKVGLLREGGIEPDQRRREIEDLLVRAVVPRQRQPPAWKP
jgi:hypothetical protein